ncbi:MAG: ABC transporter ATP-binding protein, partial [Candidatus Eremiobacteraeota bacterium]|nr:ABC transporter ATP-binding protein [Candidatus Eremiobacteraeota bacterium]
MIELRGVEVRAGNRTLLRGVNFDVRTGEFVAILGPNGVGKTTLLRAMAGSGPVSAGSVQIGARNVAAIAATARARSIAFMASDEVFGEHLTVRDVIAMGRYAYHRWWQWREDARDDAAIERALQAVRMSEFSARAFETLSSGERQCIWLALGLAQEAPVLL